MTRPVPQGVAAEGGDDPHDCSGGMVATMAALTVCIRFSAWSKTMDAEDWKMSSVTSSASSANFSQIWRPVAVSRYAGPSGSA